jgi:site-specific DNA-methyltransferase (cytosine-N4-specific)
VFDLVAKVSKETKLKMYDRYIWQKTNTLPYQGKRLNDRIEFIIHWVKTKNLKANTEEILQPYSENSLKRMKEGYTFSTNQKVVDGIRQTTEKKEIKPKKGTKPSTVFNFKNAGAIKNKGEKHPAPFHPDLPEFFIKWLTDEGDVVLDPFAGSFTTYKQSTLMNRKSIAFEINEDYKIFLPIDENNTETDGFWD